MVQFSEGGYKRPKSMYMYVVHGKTGWVTHQRYLLLIMEVCAIRLFLSYLDLKTQTIVNFFLEHMENV